MIDFPDSPTDGQRFPFNNVTYVWDDTKGCWYIEGAAPNEHHAPAGEGSWRITGTTLECWGAVTTNALGDASVAFPKTFVAGPHVQTTSHGLPGDTAFRGTGAYSSTSTGCGLYARLITSSTTTAAITIHWYAIGEWDGVS